MKKKKNRVYQEPTDIITNYLYDIDEIKNKMIKNNIIKYYNFDDETIKLGDYENYIQGEHNKLIIGYYDEEGLTYYLYRLSTNNDGTTKIWELAKNKDDSFDNVGWIATFVENPLDLIMVEFNEVPNVNDGDYHRFGIYTIVGKELVKVR